MNEERASETRPLPLCKKPEPSSQKRSGDKKDCMRLNRSFRRLPKQHKQTLNTEFLNSSLSLCPPPLRRPTISTSTSFQDEEGQRRTFPSLGETMRNVKYILCDPAVVVYAISQALLFAFRYAVSVVQLCQEYISWMSHSKTFPIHHANYTKRWQRCSVRLLTSLGFRLL